jgi:hypothetical protein
MSVSFVRLHVLTLARRYGQHDDVVAERWSERAAVREYDGGMSRHEAEGAALADVRRWLAESFDPIAGV